MMGLGVGARWPEARAARLVYLPTYKEECLFAISGGCHCSFPDSLPETIQAYNATSASPRTARRHAAIRNGQYLLLQRHAYHPLYSPACHFTHHRHES